MRLYKSRTKNSLYFFYRIINQVFDPLWFIYGVYGYFWFIKDVIAFKAGFPKEKVLTGNLFPMLHDKKKITPIDAHYFYQQIWCFDQIRKNTPPDQHVDIGSSYELCGYVSLLVKTLFVDLRPISASLKNLSVVKGNLLNLPFPDNSLRSMSCLHVVEHIGLGRYGDAINPKGSELACRELARVLAPGGRLYLSLPIGKERLCFNAHRVHSPQTILRYFEGLKLVSFNAVDDDGHYKENIEPSACSNAVYGCGMFMFEKPN